MESMIVYKVTKEDGRSQHQNWRWPLPVDGEPGEWVELDPGHPTIGLCKFGLHGWLTEEKAFAERHDNNCMIFEMELEGTRILKDNEKACGTRARLTRVLFDREGMVIPLADYVWQ